MARRKDLIAALRTSDVAELAQLREDGETLSVAGETFKGLQLVDIEVSGIDFSNTEWDECLFDRVRFGDAELEGTLFNTCTFLASTFEGTGLGGVAFDGCVLKRSIFAHTAMVGTELTNTQLEECTLEAVTLDDVEWSSVSFSEGRLVGVTGESGHLAGVKLRQVTLDGFDTSALVVEHCSFTGDGEAPEGFSVHAGRRKRV